MLDQVVALAVAFGLTMRRDEQPFNSAPLAAQADEIRYGADGSCLSTR